MLYSISQFVLIHAILNYRLEMKPEKWSAGKNIVGGVKKVSSLAAKKQRPLRFKEGRRGQSSSSSDDEVLENKVLFLF